MDKLSPSLFVQGRTVALMDVLEIIDCVQSDLKRHKRKQNYKTYRAIIECMIENRTILREVTESFVRCKDDVNSDLEVFVERSS